MDELELDIHLLELKAEVKEEKLKLRTAEMKREYAPKTLFNNYILQFVEKYALAKLAARLFKKRRNRKK